LGPVEGRRPRRRSHRRDVRPRLALPRLVQGRCRGSAFPWLLGIAQNLLRDSLRRQRIEDRARARLGLPRELATDAGYELVEERLSLPEAALKAIADLPEADRQVLDLRVVEGRPYNEIAAELSCTQVAARLRVSRALRRLNIAIGGNQ
jgi:RNA polymerase sigma factor (sigma-70 family)